MYFKKIASIALFTALCAGVSAQKFSEPSFSFSHKKNSFITLVDGKVIEGEIDDIDREKGLIEEIKIRDTNGKKHKLKPEQVKFMYLPPSGLDKLISIDNYLTDATMWEETDLNKDIIGKGFVYFEQAEVQIKKKKTMKLLVQLLNPSFSSNIKVYHDPMAKETASIGVGGMTLAGGDAKSYYVSVNGGTAFRLYKKNYEESLQILFGKCPDFIAEISKDLRWVDLDKQVSNFGKKCN